MNIELDPPKRWTTSSFGTPADTTPAELAELRDHLDRCGRQRDRWFAWKCAADKLNDFAAPRLMTTFVLFVAVSAIVCLVW
jgi:hypothetical protein